MKLYLVRHGESEGNAGPTRQGFEGNLTEKGVRQAEFLAERFKTISIDTILSSTSPRAKQTTEIINRVISKPIEYSDKLIERIHPSELIGRPKDDPEVLKLNDLMLENFGKPNWRHSDEETFEELMERAKWLLQYALESNVENLLVVTHGFYMRMILGYVIFGKQLTPEEFWSLAHAFYSHNTGITVLEYIEHKSKSQWKFTIWNDHAHLGAIKD